MLAEFVSAIASMAKNEEQFQRMQTQDETELVRFPDGTVREFPRVPALRKFTTIDIDAFVSVLESQETTPIVCIESKRAIGFFDRTDLRERIELVLCRSSEVETLTDLAQFVGHKQAVHLVRDNLFDAVPPDLLPSLRSVDFKRRNDGSRSVEHGRESLGRSVEQTVQSQSGELTEFYTFTMPMYGNEPFSGFQFDIRTSLDTDATNEKLRFILRGDDFNIASHRAAQFVRSELEKLLPETVDVIIADHSVINRDAG